LGSRDDLAVDNERSGAVMIEGGNAEDPHILKTACR
jgi:hypothetical protein